MSGGGGKIIKRVKAGEVLYVARVELPAGVDGKRRRKEFVRSTRKEAAAARAEWLRSPEAVKAQRTDTPAQTVEATIRAYLADIKRAGTRRGREALLRKYVLGVHGREGTAGYRLEPTALAALGIAEVTRHHVRDACDAVRSAGSRVNLWRALKAVLEFAVERGWCATNPLVGARAPGRGDADAPLARDRVWTPEQCRAFAAHEAVRRHPLGAMFCWWLRVGLRGGEVYALRWDDIDLGRGTITVRATLDVGGGGAAEPKTLHSHRTFEMDAEAIAYLQALPARSGWVWPGAYGRPLGHSGVLKALKRLCKATGLPERTTHELRHTHATLLLLAGVPPVEVAARLGHASAVTTMRTYAHFIPSHSKAAAAIESILLGP
jgi:integrase